MKIFDRPLSIFLLPTACLLLLLYWFFPWFKPGIITYGDWGFRFFDPLNPNSIKYLWNPGGFGEFSILWGNLYWIGEAQNFFRKIFGFYDITGAKPAFYFPYLIFLFLSTATFSLKFFKTNLARLTFFLVFALNTYLLLLAQGGLITLACSAVLLPLIFTLFYKSLETSKLRWAILTGLVFALSLAYDPRMAFLNLLVLALFGGFWLLGRGDRRDKRDRLKGIAVTFLVMGMVTISWHANWILPGIFYQAPAVPQGYDQPYWVSLLSNQGLADGLTSFHAGFAPQLGLAVGQTPTLFFVLGILGVLGILINRKKPLTLFFGLLFLFFAFLVKGSNPPLGQVYIWIFKYVPGFNMFRDPTKFFAPLSFGLAYLVSTFFDQALQSAPVKFSIFKLALVAVLIGYFVALLPPVWTHSLGGTFVSRQVPRDYRTVKEFLAKQPDWFRTLWVPGATRWSYQTTLHPALSALNIANQEPFGQPFPGQTAWQALSFLWQENSNDPIDLAGVKYIFVSLLEDDATPVINDNPIDRGRIKERLDSLNWLTALNLGTPTILAYENKDYLPLMWIEARGDGRWKVEKEEMLPTGNQIINPTLYLINKPLTIEQFSHLTGQLVFSQTYDSGWVLKVGDQRIESQKCYGLYNCFELTNLENSPAPQPVKIEYSPQKYADWGIRISLTTILFTLFTLFVLVLLILQPLSGRLNP